MSINNSDTKSSNCDPSSTNSVSFQTQHGPEVDPKINYGTFDETGSSSYCAIDETEIARYYEVQSK